MKITSIFLVLAIFMIIFSGNLHAQSNSGLLPMILYGGGISPNSNNYTQKLTWHQGFIIKDNQDTLKGFVKLSAKKNLNNILFVSDTLINPQLIEVENVSLVKLFDADTTISNQTYTEYVKLGNNKKGLWRKIIAGKNISIYDNKRVCNEIPRYFSTDYLLIVQNNKEQYVMNFWDTSPKKALIKKVNIFYGTRFTTKDFKNTQDIINWLKRNTK